MSDGPEAADIVGALLRGFADLIAIVPVERIKLGTLPEGTPLPQVLLSATSTVERKPLKRPAAVRTTERVSVKVRADNLRDQRLLRRLVVRCCAHQAGDIGGGSAVSITTDGAGPEGIGLGGAFERTQDFRVSHDVAV
jgi:hypothetical protein